MNRFNQDNFDSICTSLALKDRVFKTILDEYGPPPMWTRPNSFDTLVLTILEQQVSLASAYAAYKKLKDKTGELIPQSLLDLSDEELRACYFSRQKIVYARGLAEAVLNGSIDLEQLSNEPDELVRKKLKALKGIGDWTVDIYLIHALQHADVFPLGDLALVNSIRMLLQYPEMTREEMMLRSSGWKPYRSVATMMFWHYYIKKKNIRLLH
jgi:DNA-3-methyladenine glycosylase II